MGIAVKELLALEYFKDFYVVAGRGGLNKEIQGVTILEAPDATRWARGKELILSSGYVIHQDPECICRAFKEGNMQGTAAMMIKRDRYLDQIPEEISALFEENDIPLISMPFSIPWMELMSQINTEILNRTIRRFNISTGKILPGSNQTYKEQKIRRILKAVESEMHFPAFLYDLAEEKGYYSSPNFQQITSAYGLTEKDFWETSLPHTRHTLSDDVNMFRIRLINQEDSEEPRVSWITIPIVMNDITQAYFVVMEDREFLDYYDEFAIRIAFIVLQNLYEQILAVQSVGNVGFENLVHVALDADEKDTEKLVYQANIQGISVSDQYYFAVFQQENPKASARSKRTDILEIFQKCKLGQLSRMAFLDENEGVLLIQKDSLKKESKLTKDDYALLREFGSRVQEKFPPMKMTFGLSLKPGTLIDLRESVEKCRRVLEMGRIILPGRTVWEYTMLGPLTWLNIPKEELESLLDGYRQLLEEEKNRELLKTMKVYLENNMNYSTTAEKMYVHINTIRKRIDKINEMISIDLQDPVSRLKNQLLLQYLAL